MRKYSLYFAWLVACMAMLGSLYFSEVRNIEPCHLCWYQRIVIYPLTIILGMAVYRGFIGIIPYVLPFVVIGILLSSYQVLIQEIPNWQPIELCGAGPSCADKIDIGLGPITIPMLSLGALLLMFTFLLTADKELVQFNTSLGSKSN